MVADVALDQAWLVAGYVDRDATRDRGVADRHPVPSVVTESELAACLAADRLPDGVGCVALGIGDNATRSSCVAVLGNRCAPFLIHSRATVSPSAQFGPGTVVLPGAVVNADAKVGRGVIVNTGAVIEHDCTIADCAHVSPGAVLTGGVSVGSLSWIGAGAIVLPRIRIGERVTIGAGAVVTRNVEDGVTVVGNPARVRSNARD